jgi:hypothetical protein
VNHRYRTPLKEVRGLGSAKAGTHHFFVQRVGETIRRFARVDCHLAARDEASSGIGRADSLWTHQFAGIERDQSIPSCTLRQVAIVEAIVSGAIRTLAVTRSAPKVARRTVRLCS